MSVVENLKKTLLFGRLDDADIAAVASQMREVRYSAGQSIFARGDQAPPYAACGQPGHSPPCFQKINKAAHENPPPNHCHRLHF